MKVTVSDCRPPCARGCGYCHVGGERLGTKGVSPGLRRMQGTHLGSSHMLSPGLRRMRACTPDRRISWLHLLKRRCDDGHRMTVIPCEASGLVSCLAGGGRLLSQPAAVLRWGPWKCHGLRRAGGPTAVVVVAHGVVVVAKGVMQQPASVLEALQSAHQRRGPPTPMVGSTAKRNWEESTR